MDFWRWRLYPQKTIARYKIWERFLGTSNWSLAIYPCYQNKSFRQCHVGLRENKKHRFHLYYSMPLLRSEKSIGTKPEYFFSHNWSKIFYKWNRCFRIKKNNWVGERETGRSFLSIFRTFHFQPHWAVQWTASTFKLFDRPFSAGLPIFTST